METIHIPAGAVSVVSTSSKGDQSKWLIREKWGRARAVINMQLNDPAYEKLLVRGANDD